MTKTCRHCGEEKPADQFYRHKRVCKRCYIANVTANGWHLRSKKQAAMQNPDFSAHSMRWI